VELRHLRYFVAVAEELHFGRAALRLHIAQPPLSQRIRRLEHELGVSLFDRTKRRVALTDAGRALLIEARLTLAQAERARQVVSQTALGEAGQLIVGYMASAELSVFPRLLPVLHKRLPAVELVLKLLGAAEQMQLLRSGEIHAGFLRLPAKDRTLKVVPLVSEPLVAALPEGHRLARRRSVALRELQGERFVLFPRPHAPGFYDFLLTLCRRAGVNPTVAHETNRLHTALSLVASGRGVSLVPRCVGQLGRAGVVCRPLRPRAPDTAVGLAYNPANASALLRNVVAVVEQVFRVNPSRSPGSAEGR
jgi:DNA-binding transcriptional LysR family regulator